MKLFLAGISSAPNIKEIKNIDYVLESYYTVRKNKSMLERIKNKEFKCFLLDSGAYTFLEQARKGKQTQIDWDNYLREYIDFINKYDIDYFFELDIDSIVGLRKVEEYRQILEQKTGKKSIPVWHFSRGKDYFIKMCQEYDYVAFGGILTDGISTKEILKYLPWFTKTAHKYNCKIHGLGLTVNGLEKTGLDSADSTSWTSGSRFGSLVQFDGEKIITVARSDEKKRVKSPVKGINSHNLKEWIKYQKYLDQYK